MAEQRKSVFWAYVCWLFGGFFGLHLFYLERDAHAFLTWSTFGGYCVGWIFDVTKIPRYVREYNNEPQVIQEFIGKLRAYKKPPFSTSRFISAVMVSYFWGQLTLMSVPEEEFGGFDLRFFHWLIPLSVSLGVWIVGNIGRERGSPWLSTLVSYCSYSSRLYFYDDYWLIVMVFCTALTFDTFSKQWDRSPKRRKPLFNRLLILGLCAAIYCSLWGAAIYFNGKITDSNGDEVPVSEALHHFFTSPWWTDLKQSLYDTYQYAQHHGWYEIWKQIIDLSDPHGEQNAYKVLGVSALATQAEITAKWRALSREFHPDKVKDASLQREAQERFMEIQQAYEILSRIKAKRNRKNKKSV